MNKPKIAIIGSSSMVGSRFCELSQNDFELIKTDLNGEIPVDITNKNSVKDFFKNYDFDYVILFSAFTDVDAAQKQEDQKDASAWRINVSGTEKVAAVAAHTGRKLIFISTEVVFDGTKGPYSEEEPYGPDFSKISWYGKTKIEGEKKVLKSAKNLIVRISYPYRSNFAQKTDFARSILKMAKGNNLYPMFDDQIITPTFVDDLSPAIKLLIEKKQTGIFHVASPAVTTPYEFAKYLTEIFAINTKVEKGSLRDFLKKPGSTPRPQKGGLKTKKIENLGLIPTSWHDGIQKMHKQLFPN